MLISLAVCAVLAAEAQAAAPELLREASAAARVGDGARAIGLLRPPRPEAGPPAAPALEGEAALAGQLVLARALLISGRPVDAIQAIAELDTPELAEPVALIRLRAATAEGEPQTIKGAADAVLALSGVLDSTRAEALLRRAEALVKLDPDQGKAALRRLSAKPPSKAILPLALAALGEAGDREADRRLLIELGDTAQGLAARDRLPLRSLSSEERFERAQHLFGQRAYDLASADYRAIIAGPASAKMKQEAHLRIGINHQRQRERYDEALSHFQTARRGPDKTLADEAVFRVGLVQGSLGRYREASRTMQTYMERAPKGRYAHSASYQIGRLLHQGGFYDDAIAKHEVFLDGKPRDRVKYVWFHGWSYYRKGDCKGARRIWSGLLKSRNTLVGPKALYWTARCHLKEGNTAEGERTLDALARRAPLSYYGFLGARLAGVPLPRIVEHQPPETAFDVERLERRLPNASSAALRKARLLAWAGYPRMAREAVDLDALGRVVRKRLGRKAGARAMHQVELLLELWGEQWRALPKSTRRLAWSERLASIDDDRARQVYPPAYAELAQAAGRMHGVSPWWLLAHMLQESRYRERAKSHARALGLMQIIPRTGFILADKVGFPSGAFVQDQLFEPGVGLRHAAWYLDALRKEYSDMILAIAAYNGGPRRMTEHLQVSGHLPYDEMLEELGAHETRNYARKVSDHVVRYLSLYANETERKQWLDTLAPPEKAATPKGVTRF